MSHKIETIFGGVAVLFVFGVAAFGAFAVMNQPNTKKKNDVTTVSGALAAISEAKEHAADARPRVCFETASKIGAAGKFDVLSPVYQTGFEDCGTGADLDLVQAAWAAGWVAGTSADLKPFERSFEAWRRAKAKA